VVDDLGAVGGPDVEVIEVGVVVDEDGGDGLGAGLAGGRASGQDLVAGLEAGDGHRLAGGQEDLGGQGEARPANGNHIEADTCTGLLSQRWTFNPNGTITVGSYCIDNTGSATTSGNPIQLHACDGTSAQVWAHPDNGTFYNPAATMCIEDSNGNTGVQLVLETCTYNANQTWAYPDTYNR
jgi:hypothetical protein